jgi:hypothetical protein
MHINVFDPSKPSNWCACPPIASCIDSEVGKKDT